MLKLLLFLMVHAGGRHMSWEKSPSKDALNCYVVETVQKVVLRTNSGPTTDDVRFYQTYSRRVCGPPFAWDLPPDPDPGTVQFFCVRAVDTSNNFSDCGDITFVP